MSNDAISDSLTRIRNAQRAGHKVVKLNAYKPVKAFVEVLKVEGFIDGYEVTHDVEAGFDVLTVFLKYFGAGEPVIKAASRVSKPGRRVYSHCEDLPRVKHSLGISVVSTSQGVMSDREARRRKIGGEVLALIG